MWVWVSDDAGAHAPGSSESGLVRLCRYSSFQLGLTLLRRFSAVLAAFPPKGRAFEPGLTADLVNEPECSFSWADRPPEEQASLPALAVMIRIMLFAVTVLSILPSSLSAPEASLVTISNTIARSDTAGRLMDMHDGMIKQWGPGGLCECAVQHALGSLDSHYVPSHAHC